MGADLVPSEELVPTTTFLFMWQRAGPDTAFKYPKEGKAGDVEAEDSRIWRRRATCKS